MESPAQGKDRLHQVVGWTLLACLLLLRIPFYVGISQAFLKEPTWLYPVFEIGNYLLIACLIWWERDRLVDFNIDKLALSIIILFKPIMTIIEALQNPYRGFSKFRLDPIAFPNLPSLALWAISIGLVLALWRSRARLPRLTKASFGWFGVGLLAGLVLILAIGYPMSSTLPDFYADYYGKPNIALFSQAPVNFLFMLGYAAVTEEPLFRAFLWGFLQKAGLKPFLILLVQTGLFMLGHIYYLNSSPLTFWLSVSSFGLVAGLLVWWTKTISSSMAAHAMGNAIYRAVYIIFLWYKLK